VMDLETEHPGVKQSMLKALSNVAPRHLLDVRLNPPAELRARVAPSQPAAAADADDSESVAASVIEPRLLRVFRAGELPQPS